MKKVLFVCGQEFILDQKDGGKKCSYRNYRMLQEVYGAENVYAYIFTNDFQESNMNVIREKSHSSLFGKIIDVALLRSFYPITFEKKIFNYIVKNKFDMVFFERSMFGPLIKKLKTVKIETQVFVHNIEKNYVWNKVKAQSICFLLPYFSTKINEKITFKYCDFVIGLTERDNEIMETLYQRHFDAIIPMTFHDVFDISRLSHEKIEGNSHKKLLFVGSFFPPNYDGIKWFVENVMNELSEFQLVIVGKDFEKCKEELSRENVQVIGTVDDLEQYYYSEYAMVMPILYGDGIKIKTAEAMIYGKMIFASDEALEGYEVENIDGIYRCNTAEEYISTIREVFSENSYIGYLESVRECFVKKYNNAIAVNRYKDAIKG